MKKHILYLSLLATSGFAQGPVITDADMVQAGSTILMAFDDESLFNAGDTGNVNWDFSSLKNFSQDTFNFIGASGLLGSSAFTDANLAFIDVQGGGFTSYNYLKKSTSSLAGLGAAIDDGTGIPIIVRLTTPEMVIPFPLTMNSSFTNTGQVDTVMDYGKVVQGTTIDYVRIKRYKYRDGKVNAYGNLTTPVGTFPALRLYAYEIAYDSIWYGVKIPFIGGVYWTLAPAPFTTAPDTSHNYEWYADNHGYALASMEVDTATGDAIAGIRWLIMPADIISKTDVSCSGTNGNATVGVSGGVAPYTYSWYLNPFQTSAQAVNLPAGTYTVNVIDQNGLSDTAMVVINGIPSAPVADFSINYVNGQSNVNVTSTGTNATNYVWYFTTTDSSAGGATSAFTYTTQGTKTICLRAYNACFSDSVCKNVVITTTGLADLTSNDFQIRFANNQVEILNVPENALLYFYNMIGQEVVNYKLNPGHSSISLKEMNKGIYIYRVVSNGADISGKVEIK